MMVPTSTLNAYNYWGNNLYESATKVSLLRPIAPGFISKPEIEDSRIADTGEPNENYEADYFKWLEKHDLPQWVGAAGWATYEHPFVRWAEGEGYRFDYMTSEDLIQPPNC